MDQQKEKKYEKPKMDIITFPSEDIILTSPAAEIPDESLIP